ncbi:MAG: hypothetical protein MJE68_25920, partial [Proteobacteria bacterium]|nr:hypothetical protein [Pseudomonadota bacterium]
DLPPLKIGLPNNIMLDGDCPPPLKFDAMRLSSLEQNPEINPVHVHYTVISPTENSYQVVLVHVCDSDVDYMYIHII